MCVTRSRVHNITRPQATTADARPESFLVLDFIDIRHRGQSGMRFRATIEHVDTFASKEKPAARPVLTDRTVEIVQSVEKLQKRCTIKFAEHEMRIICPGDANEGGIQVWSYVLSVSPFFSKLTWHNIAPS